MISPKWWGRKASHPEPQCCRHSFVALALSSASLPEVAALARHGNARVTAQVYAGVTDRCREVAAAKLVEIGFGR